MQSGESLESCDNTDLYLLYERIYKWHKVNKHKSKLLSKLRNKYLGIVQDLPDPKDASVEDISFVCIDISDGKMAWSRDEKDEHGVKMSEYTNSIIEKLGGYLQVYQTAEKSKLSWKYWQKRNTLKKLLNHLSAEELRRIYRLYTKNPTVSEIATKNFVLRRIMEEIPSDQLFSNPKISSILASEFEKLLSFFRNRVQDLEESEVRQICVDLEEEETSKKYKSKAKMLDQLFKNVSIGKIMESKLLQKKLRPKLPARKDIRKIDSSIKALSEDLKQLYQKDSDLLPYIQRLEQKIQYIMKHQEELATLLGMNGCPDTLSLLESLRKELIASGEPMSPNALVKIIKKAQDELHTDQLSFTLKSLEVMLSIYLLDKIKKMQWPPDFQEFLRLLREEIPKIQILPNQAEIPTLRERVIKRLGISEPVFDKQLVQAWLKGNVALHSGAPRGRDEVKYLEYKGNKYFYVSLTWG